MADVSNQTVSKLFSTKALTAYRHEPGNTTPAVPAWADMRDFEHFGALVLATALTGDGVTKLELVAATSAAGDGLKVITTHTPDPAPETVGDYVVIEGTAEQIRQCGVGYRYAGVRVTIQNSADKTAVFYIRDGARFAHAGLTADNVQADS